MHILPETRKSYLSPEVVVELDLETRAGTPLGFINPLDPAE